MPSATPAAPTLHLIHIPPLGAVAGEVRATAGLPRNDAVAALKALRQREATALAAYQLDHLAETTGLDICLQITALTDELVRVLAERACAKIGAPAGWQDKVGILAVGGYGRGEMNPYSDLDLLVLDLHPSTQEWSKKLYAELAALLWDVKFTVGSAQRSLPELERMIENDPVTATAIVECRAITAGEPVRSAMAQALERFRRRHGTTFLKAKLDELAKRRQAAGASLFVMEPNLKSNPGCLRDVQLLRNMAFIAVGSRNILALEELEAITRADLTGVLATNDHILALRSLLHFHHGRKQDVFQLPDQVRIAKLMGYADVSRLRGVEHLMKRHYAQVWHVHQVLELAVSRLGAKGFLGRQGPLIKTRRKLDECFSAILGLVYLADREFWRRGDAGARLLRMCREAQRRGWRLSVELQRQIQAHRDEIDDAMRGDPGLGRVMLEILGDAGRIHPILADMHGAGLLGAYLPEFGNLTCHMQFDSYHQYTVDEHTLIAMRNLDRLAAGEAEGLPGMRAIFAALPRKDLLALSLLLHDMGKYMGRGHVPRGAIMVGQVARRLGLERAEEDHVHFLVERHVVLSDASRMRNFHEPSFLAPFAEQIGDQGRLDALYCLTWCDAKAVGEGILTGWQEAVLGELYAAVRDRLAGHPPADRHARIIAELTGGGVPQAAAEAHLRLMSGSYEYQMAAGEALRHHRVLAEARADGIGLSHEVGERFSTVSLALPDRHALMADVAATLSGHGFDTNALRTWVTGDGMVVYTMRLTSIYPSGRLAEAAPWQRLRADLAAVSQGRLDAQALLARRRAAIVVNRAADSGFDDHAVKVEQLTSGSATIIDVQTRDEVGLLSRLCRAISEHGGEIGYACINTMGDVAVDVFYVTREGRKLNDEDAEGLRQRLIAALGLAA